ncbi:hypothetical protein CDV36_013948 [Fusarium kuroshium]|uniref:Uncharacterized protein n=1 Tax=Fusarium kuroshium TaxID=2010991 RepID=A0A3M2RMI3_9HYPO|nr:hypothetical protein CDV36_013948 [Fusarium kuroshium]
MSDSGQSSEPTGPGIIQIYEQSFSAISPYLITCPPYGDPVNPDINRYRKDCPSYNAKYPQAAIWNSMANEASSLIRKELQAIFFEETALYLRSVEPYRPGWRRGGLLTTINEPSLSKQWFAPEATIEYLNKQMMVYFEPTSVTSVEGDRLGRYVYREWLRLHDGRPPFQRHNFFAKAVQIGEKGPRNLQEPTAFHKALCGVISAHLDDMVDFYPEVDQKMDMDMDPPAERSAIFGPRPSQRVQSWRDHGHTMCHLFRALYMVIDDQSLSEARGPSRARYECEDVAHYLEREHDRSLSQYTVLLVKTEDEAHLHSPISFLPLFEAGLALDVRRHDYYGACQDTVIRVRLETAIRFVWQLFRKEESCFKRFKEEAQAQRDEQEELCETCIKKVMKHSEEIGLEENGYTWLAIRRAQAKLNGEAFDDDQVNPLWEHLNHWEG